MRFLPRQRIPGKNMGEESIESGAETRGRLSAAAGIADRQIFIQPELLFCIL